MIFHSIMISLIQGLDALRSDLDPEFRPLSHTDLLNSVCSSEEVHSDNKINPRYSSPSDKFGQSNRNVMQYDDEVSNSGNS